jgi:hypothetical protein
MPLTGVERVEKLPQRLKCIGWQHAATDSEFDADAVFSWAARIFLAKKTWLKPGQTMAKQYLSINLNN